METTDMQQKLVQISQDVQGLTQKVNAMTIKTSEDMVMAAEVSKQITVRKKRIEELRLFFTKPLNDHIKSINIQFKSASEPLNQLGVSVDGKIAEYRTKEAARIERERRAEEERQRKEHEKQMEKERKEAEKEAEKQCKALEKEELSKKEQKAELKRIEDERLAREEEIARERESFVPEVEIKQETKVESESGTLRFRKHWTFEIIKESEVPREFLAVDETAIRKAVNAGAREIKGVRIFEEEIKSNY
jgi:hypothetical protein